MLCVCLGRKHFEKERGYMENWQNVKNAKKLLIICLFVIFAGWFLFVWDDTKIREFHMDAVNEMKQEYGFHVESVKLTKSNVLKIRNYTELTGWFTKLGENILNVSLQIVLKDTKSGRSFVVPTQMKVRKDVTEAYDDGHNYDQSGFYAKIPHGRSINLDQSDYEIYVYYQWNGKTGVAPLETTIKTWENGNAS